MVLTDEIAEKIKELVYSHPHTINDIAIKIEKNWRTANRYVEEIAQKTGLIKVMTFRQGTKGALKIVYWNNTDKIYATDIQEELFKKIELAINKSDFSPFEIYQYVDSNKRLAFYEEITSEKDYNYRIEQLIPFIEESQEEILIFGGNLSFIHLTHNNKTILQYFKEAIARNVQIKIISNLTIIDLNNIEELLSLNLEYSHPRIEIRHEITPIRGYIFDEKIARFGEVMMSSKKQHQIQSNIATYYEITDIVWNTWISKLFYQKFRKSIPSNKRIENLKSMRKINF